MLLAEAIKSIRKYAPTAIEDDLRNIEGLPTGCLTVDILTGIGGFPRGRITELMGSEGSGKTSIALHACTQCLRAERPFAYLDVERALDLTWAEHLGVSFDQKTGLYLKPMSFEDTGLIIKDLVDAGVALIIVDSVAALVPEEELKGKITDEPPIAIRARKMSMLLPKLLSVIESSSTALVLINQLRTKITTGWQPRGYQGPQEASTGGWAIKFYSSLRLQVFAKKKGSEKRTVIDKFSGLEREVAVASEHEVEAVKNRLGTAYRRAPFFIRYDEEQGIYGIDNLMTLIGMAKGEGLVRVKPGGYFTYQGLDEGPKGTVVSGHGEDAFYRAIRARPEVIKEMMTRIGLEYPHL